MARLIIPQRLVHRSIRNVAFHANDAKKHDVYWSNIAQAFMLENELDGHIRSFDTLCSALTALHVASSNVRGYGQDYLAQVPANWTVTENPYSE